MWSACKHKTFRDFSFRRDDKRLVWKCSHCGKQALWNDEAWGYYGTVECRKCSTAAIEFVWCSEACRLELKKAHPKCVDETTGKAPRRPRSPPEAKAKPRNPRGRPQRWRPCVVGASCEGGPRELARTV